MNNRPAAEQTTWPIRETAMATIVRAKITKTVVDRLNTDMIVRDTELHGFGIRRQNGVARYFLQKKIQGRARWLTIGPHGAPWTAETARKEAVRLMGEIAGGTNPADERSALKANPTVTEAFEVFIAEHGATMKPRSKHKFERLFALYIKPAFGPVTVNAVTRAQVGALHVKLKHVPMQANYVLVVIASLMTWCEDRALRDEGTNPARRIRRFTPVKRERYLDSDEFARIGKALDHAAIIGGASVFAIAAFRLLMFTGARVGEIQSLMWREVDLERGQLRLPDSKTGQKTIHLNQAAIDVLASLPRLEGNPYVIPGQKRGRPMADLKTTWGRLRIRAGVPDVRLHDLRHSFASVAAANGASLPMIGKLLGHSQPQTTARYAHLADDPLRKLNQDIGASIVEAMAGKKSTPK